MIPRCKGASSNGRIPVSKTVNLGSNPSTPVTSGFPDVFLQEGLISKGKKNQKSSCIINISVIL